MKSAIFKFKRKVNKIRELSNAATQLIKHESQDQSFYALLQNLRSFPMFNPSQRDFEIKYLFDLVKIKGCKMVGEIGCYKGGSLYILTKAMPISSKIISVDINYPLERKIAHRKFGKGKIKVVPIEGDTKDLRTFTKVKRNLNNHLFDLLFIDGDHSLEGIMNDYVRYSPLVRKGGLIVLHDIQPLRRQDPNVRSAEYVGKVPLFWKMLRDSGLKTMEIIENRNQSGAGLGIIIKQ
jgi:predicted O-methyltransferase YrrM